MTIASVMKWHNFFMQNYREHIFNNLKNIKPSVFLNKKNSNYFHSTQAHNFIKNRWVNRAHIPNQNLASILKLCHQCYPLTNLIEIFTDLSNIYSFCDKTKIRPAVCLENLYQRFEQISKWLYIRRQAMFYHWTLPLKKLLETCIF